MKRVLMGLAFASFVVACAHHQDGDSTTSDISGGLPATEYPEAATIDFQKGTQSYLCSGTVIAPKVVLTAGHCVAGGATAFMVHAGNNETFSMSASALDYVETEEVVNFSQHDVALVFLTDPIILARYPSIASSAVADNTQLMNVGRINNGVQTDSLFEASTFVTNPFEAPLDYRSSRVIQPGDSGGPDFIAGTHIIAAVNSGAQDQTNIEYLARVDLVHDWIMEQIQLHGGGGGPPTAGLITSDTLAAVNRYDVVASELNCRSGAGTASPITAQLFAGETVEVAPDASGPRTLLAPDGSTWLHVAPPGADGCYVSAKYEFLQPNPETPPPDGKLPGTSDILVTQGLFGSLALAVHGSAVTGSIREGACEFTIAGSLHGNNPVGLAVMTGGATSHGTLNVVNATTVALTLDNPPAACAGSLQQGQNVTFTQNISPIVFAFRTVKSQKSLFHDGPGSPANGKYVQTGQTVQQLSENQGGYVQVRYTGATGPTTTGWLLESDLLDTLVANTTL